MPSVARFDASQPPQSAPLGLIGGARMRSGCRAQWSAAHPADDRSERVAVRPIGVDKWKKSMISVVIDGPVFRIS